MPLFDLPLDELRTYRPDLAEPSDFDAFWNRTLQETRAYPLDPRFDLQNDSGFTLVDVDDVTFNGFGGDPIKGWMIRPAGADRPLPCVVTFVGYGGGRSLPVDHLAPAAAGLASLVMDTRGQGAGWSPGDTPDTGGAGPSYPGFLTRGIESPDTYYYRRVFADAVRAVEAAASHPAVDPKRIGVAGGSQGGGIAIAAAALLRDQVRALAADVPFLCHFRRASEITVTSPYAEISSYLKCQRTRTRQVFETLAYFDGVHFAMRIAARSLFSVALMDMVCPPSTVFAAYNRVPADKDIHVYEFNEHEGGGPHHAVERLRFLTEHL